MIRLLGAIIGSALALATLLVLVGVPQFKSDPVEIERPVMTLPVPVAAVDDAQAGDETSAESPVAASPVESADIGAPSPPTAADGPPVDDAFAGVSPTDDLFVGDSGVEEFPMEDTPVVDDSAFPPPDPGLADDEIALAAFDEQNWYAFWSPFRSEIAASGFVEQLQRVTGLDYRVVKTKPGVYEVAFAYSDDTDIPLNLSQITAATGLELPES